MGMSTTTVPFSIHSAAFKSLWNITKTFYFFLFLYIAIGSAINYSVFHKRGLEAIPHSHLWLEGPSKCFDWLIYSCTIIFSIILCIFDGVLFLCESRRYLKGGTRHARHSEEEKTGSRQRMMISPISFLPNIFKNFERVSKSHQCR